MVCKKKAVKDLTKIPNNEYVNLPLCYSNCCQLWEHIHITEIVETSLCRWNNREHSLWLSCIFINNISTKLEFIEPLVILILNTLLPLHHQSQLHCLKIIILLSKHSSGTNSVFGIIYQPSFHPRTLTDPMYYMYRSYWIKLL